MGHVLRVPPKTRCQLQVQERVVRTGCMPSVTGRAPQTQALPALAPGPWSSSDPSGLSLDSGAYSHPRLETPGRESGCPDSKFCVPLS